MTKIKTRAVKSKAVAMKLINQGFELLNITCNRDNGKPCYIFEDTEGFGIEFDKAIKELNRQKNNKKVLDFTDEERKFIIKLLEGYKQENIDDESNWTDLIDGILRKVNGDRVLQAPSNLNNDLNVIFKEGAAEKLWEHVNNNDMLKRMMNSVKPSYPWLD